MFSNIFDKLDILGGSIGKVVGFVLSLPLYRWWRQMRLRAKSSHLLCCVESLLRSSTSWFKTTVIQPSGSCKFLHLLLKPPDAWSFFSGKRFSGEWERRHFVFLRVSCNNKLSGINKSRTVDSVWAAIVRWSVMSKGDEQHLARQEFSRNPGTPLRASALT